MKEMIRLIKENKIFLILLLAAVILVLNCEEEINKPESVQFSTTVHVIDTSIITRQIYDQTGVPGAEVTLSSVNYKVIYQSRSDESGRAHFENIIPDVYNCQVQRIFPEDTILKYLGVLSEEVLVGSKAVQPLANPADSFNIALSRVERPHFILSEIYYNGAPPDPPYILYFHDQFTEIYNNFGQVEYLDGYVVGDVDYGYREDSLFVHCIHLYQFPGNGTDYPVAPGDMIIIAQDAEDHTLKNENSLDLSNADFEYYNPLSNDVDNPFVPNMIQIHHKYGFDFLYSVMNDAIVLAKLEPGDTLGYDSFNNILLPKERVIDGVEYKEDPTNYDVKRLADDIDAGITGGIPAYQGKSIARKIFRVVNGQAILTDNNNSSVDFISLDVPTPGVLE